MAEESAYPPFDRIRAMFDETHQTLLALLESTPDKVLDEPLPAEAAYAAPNKFGMFAFTAWHEGFHTPVRSPRCARASASSRSSPDPRPKRKRGLLPRPV